MQYKVKIRVYWVNFFVQFTDKLSIKTAIKAKWGYIDFCGAEGAVKFYKALDNSKF